MAENGDKVYVVVYSCVNCDDGDGNDTRVKVFKTEDEAEKYLKNDYETCLGEYEDESSPFDLISHNNYTSNAEIQVGFGDITTLVFNWRVQMKTIGYEG